MCVQVKLLTSQNKLSKKQEYIYLILIYIYILSDELWSSVLHGKVYKINTSSDINHKFINKNNLITSLKTFAVLIVKLSKWVMKEKSQIKSRRSCRIR